MASLKDVYSKLREFHLWESCLQQFDDIIPLDNEDLKKRWIILFSNAFLFHQNSNHDDLIFFVDMAQDPPVLVKRIPHTIPLFSFEEQWQSFLWQIYPNLPKEIQWPQSFFLNLIVQLPYSLTISVCKKLIQSNQVFMKGKTANTKKVYASLNKSELQHKMANTKCSYPFIYFVNDNYEETFETLCLENNDYLCVELGVDIIDSSCVSVGENSEQDLVQKISNSKKKLVLFIGAISCASLSEAFHKRKTDKDKDYTFQWPFKGKGIATEGHNSKQTPSYQFSQSDFEFVLMKGPEGKGQAQVAVKALIPDFETTPSHKTRLSSNGLKHSINTVSSLFTQALPQTIKKISSHLSINGSSTENPSPKVFPLSNEKGTQKPKKLKKRKSEFDWAESSTLSFSQSFNQSTLETLPTEDTQSSGDSRITKDKEFGSCNREMTFGCCLTFVNLPVSSILKDLHNYCQQNYNLV